MLTLQARDRVRSRGVRVIYMFCQRVRVSSEPVPGVVARSVRRFVARLDLPLHLFVVVVAQCVRRWLRHCS